MYVRCVGCGADHGLSTLALHGLQEALGLCRGNEAACRQNGEAEPARREGFERLVHGVLAGCVAGLVCHANDGAAVAAPAGSDEAVHEAAQPVCEDGGCVHVEGLHLCHEVAKAVQEGNGGTSENDGAEGPAASVGVQVVHEVLRLLVRQERFPAVADKSRRSASAGGLEKRAKPTCLERTPDCWF